MAVPRTTSVEIGYFKLDLRGAENARLAEELDKVNKDDDIFAPSDAGSEDQAIEILAKAMGPYDTSLPERLKRVVKMINATTPLALFAQQVQRNRVADLYCTTNKQYRGHDHNSRYISIVPELERYYDQYCPGVKDGHSIDILPPSVVGTLGGIEAMRGTIAGLGYLKGGAVARLAESFSSQGVDYEEERSFLPTETTCSIYRPDKMHYTILAPVMKQIVDNLSTVNKYYRYGNEIVEDCEPDRKCKTRDKRSVTWAIEHFFFSRQNACIAHPGTDPT